MVQPYEMRDQALRHRNVCHGLASSGDLGIVDRCSHHHEPLDKKHLFHLSNIERWCMWVGSNGGFNMVDDPKTIININISS